MSLQTTTNSLVNWGKRNSPYILFGMGMISLCGAVAEAVHATTKLGYILDTRTAMLQDTEDYYKDALDDPDLDLDVDTRKSLENNKAREIKKINNSAVLDICKLYAPTVAITALSIFSFGSSFSILNKRYLGVSAALTATTKTFEAYRDRVRAEENGEIKDFAYLHGLDLEESEKTIVDEETGKKKKVKQLEVKGTPTGQFTFRFEKYDPNKEIGFEQWQSVNTYSWPIVSGIIAHRQRQLEIGKMVMLHDVLRDLGAGDNLFYEENSTAGWLPGDIILSGLEEGADIMSGDATQYLYGDCPDVTLIFNCRPNVFAKDEDVKSPVEYKKIELKEEPSLLPTEVKSITGGNRNE